MKKIIVQISMLFAVVLSLASCKDKTVEQPTTSTRVVKIENDDDYAEFGYNQAGQISSMLIKDINNALIVSYSFAYANGKITEVAGAGHKWKYTYTGNLVTKVEVSLPNNVVVRRYEYSYTNGRLMMQTEYASNIQGTLIPETKVSYSYTPAGNVSKSETYDFVNNAWLKSDEIRITAYDNKINASIHYENFPYLPNITFLTNNPLIEEHRTANGNIYATVNYEYTYDNAGRVATRKMKHNVIGFPQQVYNTKYFY